MSIRDTETQRDGDTEKRRHRETKDTQDTDEVPPLSARVSALPEAVQLSLQNGWHEQALFVFSRALRAFEITVGKKLSGDDLKAAFSLWWSSAQPLLPNAADFDEYRFVFQNTFAKTHSALCSNSLHEAMRVAGASPLPAHIKRYASPEIQRLVAVCYSLQSRTHGQPFFLSVRAAARALGITCPRRAGEILTGLVADAVLTLIEPGKRGGKRAARYRFNAPEFSTIAQMVPECGVDIPATEAPVAATLVDSHKQRPLSHFQLVEKKKALQELIAALGDREGWDDEKRSQHRKLRPKLRQVREQLGMYGDQT